MTCAEATCSRVNNDEEAIAICHVDNNSDESLQAARPKSELAKIWIYRRDRSGRFGSFTVGIGYRILTSHDSHDDCGYIGLKRNVLYST